MKTKILLVLLLVGFMTKAQNANFKISMEYPKTNISEESNARKDLKDIKKYNDSLANLELLNSIDDNKKEEYGNKIQEIIDKYNSDNENSIYTAYEKSYSNAITKINTEILELLDSMNEDDIDIEKLKTLEKEVNNKKEDIVIFENKLQSIKDIQFLKSSSFHMFFGKRKSNAFFNILYGENAAEINFLNNNGILLGNKTGSIYSELASGNIKVIRFSIGTMVSNSSATDESEEEAFNRLATSGGNTVLNAEYPLILWSDSNNQFNFIGRALGRLTADFPAFGTQTNSFAGSGSLGIDLYADASTSNNEIRFYGNYNYARFNGSEVFRENLQIDNKNFYFGKLTAGIVIKQKVNLSVIFNTFSSEENLKSKHIIIGGSLMF